MLILSTAGLPRVERFPYRRHHLQNNSRIKHYRKTQAAIGLQPSLRCNSSDTVAKNTRRNANLVGAAEIERPRFRAAPAEWQAIVFIFYRAKPTIEPLW
jgi:hypothetical protein